MTVRVVTTVLAPAIAVSPASPYDLVDLEDAKDELDIPEDDTSKDAFLSRAITQSSAAISRYCQRVFAVELVQDLLYIEQYAYPWQVPGGVGPLQLSRWPLVDHAAVALTGNTHGTIVVDGIASTSGVSAGMPIFAADGSIPAGTVVSEVLPTALLLSAPATDSSAAVALTAGMSVVQTLAAGVTQSIVFGTDYAVDAERGWLLRLNEWTGVSERWEAEPIAVTYRAGYSTVPADLEDACLRLVTARYHARGRDPSVVERSQGGAIGTERFWVGGRPGQSGAFPPDVQALIEPFRVPAAA